MLAAVLGCGHALLPGHGKTVMAAYLAGRGGRRRDALVVGATVTVTHTAGVLVLGLTISVSSSLAGEQALRWLGVVSGLLVAGIGAAMLRSAVGGRSSTPTATVPAPVPRPALVGTASSGHVHGHDHAHDHAHDQGLGHAHPHGEAKPHGWGRAGLVGMGVAGGLVPSPSALVVLLASAGLGRTAFGIALVLAYGLGMAATLTAAGLVLIGLQARLERHPSRRLPRQLARVGRVLPVATAALVCVVGLVLAARGLAG